MRTQTTKTPPTARGREAVPALLAAVLFLAGCSATHVGDAWQCPVAQGTACTSIAAADPAVASPEKVQGRAIPEPPGQLGADDPGRSGDVCAEDCGGPGWFAWLAKWFDGPEEPDEGTASVEPASASWSEEAPALADDGLRTRERIARIWIAPFVDSDGVYREGHWVRTVLEPARWRVR